MALCASGVPDVPFVKAYGWPWLSWRYSVGDERKIDERGRDFDGAFGSQGRKSIGVVSVGGSV